MMIKGFTTKGEVNEDEDAGYGNLFPSNTKPPYDVQELD